MPRSYREAKHEANEQASGYSYNRDESGRIIVNMTVKDDTDFLSVFSVSDTPVISSDVADFIEEATRSVLPNEKLTLRIHSNCIDESEKGIYKEAIREHYLGRFAANKREQRRNTCVMLVLGVVGIAILALMLFSESLINNAVWSEVMDIVAWVLIWESVHIAVFQNRELRLMKRRYLSYLSMNIEFISI